MRPRKAVCSRRGWCYFSLFVRRAGRRCSLAPPVRLGDCVDVEGNGDCSDAGACRRHGRGGAGRAVGNDAGRADPAADAARGTRPWPDGRRRQPQSGVQFQGSDNSQTYTQPQQNQTYQAPSYGATTSNTTPRTARRRPTSSRQRRPMAPASSGTYQQQPATQTYEKPQPRLTSSQWPRPIRHPPPLCGRQFLRRQDPGDGEPCRHLPLGSAALTPEAQKLLDTVGEALQAPSSAPIAS